MRQQPRQGMCKSRGMNRTLSDGGNDKEQQCVRKERRMRGVGCYSSWAKNKITASVEAAHDHASGGPALKKKRVRKTKTLQTNPHCSTQGKKRLTMKILTGSVSPQYAPQTHSPTHPSHTSPAERHRLRDSPHRSCSSKVPISTSPSCDKCTH